MPVPSPLCIDGFCDNHVHTRFCGHAVGEMEEYVRAAIGKGLRKIIFLEHMEEGILNNSGTWLTEADFDSYFSEGQRLQNLYSKRLEIGLGVECGYNPDCGDALRVRLQRRKWDRIGISCHFLKPAGMSRHLNLFSRNEDTLGYVRQFGTEKLLDLYFRTLLEAILQLPGTMLCHLDGALRHVPEIILTDLHYQMIDRLLRAASHKGMALEINTSGMNIRQVPFPSQRILSLARTYDIPLVLSSDAHAPADVGRHFADVAGFIPSGSCP